MFTIANKRVRRKRSEIRGSGAQGRLDQSRWPRKDSDKPVRFVVFLRVHLPDSLTRRPTQWQPATSQPTTASDSQRPALYLHSRRRKEMMEVSGESWRAYYSTTPEHPLSAATSAVLGVGDDQQPQALVTEYYKLPPLGQDSHLNMHKEVWSAGGALKAANGGHGAELELSGLLHAGLVKREPEDLSRKVLAEPEHALSPRHKVRHTTARRRRVRTHSHTQTAAMSRPLAAYHAPSSL
ncbi:unnamed protein product [Leptidea sinapis]|uniref:Uncharacterized protein n=1 Tax=Leptidea sinapis TaxID=189913 RepID=A0A5E4PQX7_9NEOP|nr:unnamed protein product [Leptidea sinapis]